MRVVVLGGYGGFGARISTRLAIAGHEVIVAGRNLDAATAFCSGHAGLSPLVLDRGDATALFAALERIRPCAVVDAAGPSQGASYAVPRACIAARCHYVDIADGRAFVEDIGSLDALAKQAGVAIVSGASTVPALSGAVVRQLTRDMGEVRSVEIAISASNRATVGSSVTRAILSYVGKPIRLWMGTEWTRGYGWQGLRREPMTIPGAVPIPPRLVALADVPDLTLLPRRLPGRPAVTFHAGTEFALQNLALWLLSWPMRLSSSARLERLAPVLLALQRLTARLGTDRSGMVVRVLGAVGSSRIVRCWTLIADKGDGPHIPALAVPLVIERLARGALPPGASDAGPLLSLADFEPAFDGLSIRHETAESHHSLPLYARIMGPRFDGLPAPLRVMHGFLHVGSARGRAVVTRGTGLLARIIADAIGLPATGEHNLHVAFQEDGDGETWTRTFTSSRFSSRMSQRGPWLVEAFGPLRFAFDLPSDASGLAMTMRTWWIGPVPMPLAWAPATQAREWSDAGIFAFDVAIRLPMLGLLVRYHGWLKPDLTLVDDREESCPDLR